MSDENKFAIRNQGEKNKTINKITSAQVVPIKQNLTPWNPAEGQILTGIFKGIEEITVPSLQSEGTEKIQAAVLYVPEYIYKDGKVVDKQLIQRTIAGKRAVNFFSDKPQGSMWQIVFRGQEKNKTNNKYSNAYDFYQLVSNEQTNEQNTEQKNQNNE